MPPSFYNDQNRPKPNSNAIYDEQNFYRQLSKGRRASDIRWFLGDEAMPREANAVANSLPFFYPMAEFIKSKNYDPRAYRITSYFISERITDSNGQNVFVIWQEWQKDLKESRQHNDLFFASAVNDAENNIHQIFQYGHRVSMNSVVRQHIEHKTMISTNLMTEDLDIHRRHENYKMWSTEYLAEIERRLPISLFEHLRYTHGDWTLQQRERARLAFVKSPDLVIGAASYKLFHDLLAMSTGKKEEHEARARLIDRLSKGDFMGVFNDLTMKSSSATLEKLASHQTRKFLLNNSMVFCQAAVAAAWS